MSIKLIKQFSPMQRELRGNGSRRAREKEIEAARVTMSFVTSERKAFLKSWEWSITNLSKAGKYRKDWYSWETKTSFNFCAYHVPNQITLKADSNHQQWQEDPVGTWRDFHRVSIRGVFFNKTMRQSTKLAKEFFAARQLEILERTPYSPHLKPMKIFGSL